MAVETLQRDAVRPRGCWSRAALTAPLRRGEHGARADARVEGVRVDRGGSRHTSGSAAMPSTTRCRSRTRGCWRSPCRWRSWRAGLPRAPPGHGAPREPGHDPPPAGCRDPLTLSVTAGDLRPHRRGRTLDVRLEARVGDDLVWECDSVYLSRGRGTEGAPREERRPPLLGPAGRAVAPARGPRALLRRGLRRRQPDPPAPRERQGHGLPTTHRPRHVDVRAHARRAGPRARSGRRRAGCGSPPRCSSPAPWSWSSTATPGASPAGLRSGQGPREDPSGSSCSTLRALTASCVGRLGCPAAPLRLEWPVRAMAAAPGTATVVRLGSSAPGVVWPCARWRRRRGLVKTGTDREPDGGMRNEPDQPTRRRWPRRPPLPWRSPSGPQATAASRPTDPPSYMTSWLAPRHRRRRTRASSSTPTGRSPEHHRSSVAARRAALNEGGAGLLDFSASPASPGVGFPTGAIGVREKETSSGTSCAAWTLRRRRRLTLTWARRRQAWSRRRPPWTSTSSRARSILATRQPRHRRGRHPACLFELQSGANIGATPTVCRRRRSSPATTLRTPAPDSGANNNCRWEISAPSWTRCDDRLVRHPDPDRARRLLLAHGRRGRHRSPTRTPCPRTSGVDQ